jgi:hypothetical protein
MHSDASAIEIARKNIRRAEERVVEIQKVLNHLAERSLSTELTAGLVKTFEQDLTVSREKLARLML